MVRAGCWPKGVGGAGNGRECHIKSVQTGRYKPSPSDLYVFGFGLYFFTFFKPRQPFTASFLFLGYVLVRHGVHGYGKASTGEGHIYSLATILPSSQVHVKEFARWQALAVIREKIGSYAAMPGHTRLYLAIPGCNRGGGLKPNNFFARF